MIEHKQQCESSYSSFHDIFVNVIVPLFVFRLKSQEDAVTKGNLIYQNHKQFKKMGLT